ncbi:MULTISPECIES: BPSL0761 family protein [Caballeronia]|uniref:BPSL0761 family protein n=1 Tax=Caballeronia TaxID=1827195 RepID=UPI00094F5693|nr:MULTISPECIES: BPSL0761 family protein [Caballeronia]
MTTPCERTYAVLETREFLQTLASGNEVTIPGLLATYALLLLRHFPSECELAESASIAPEIWSRPAERQLQPLRQTASLMRCQRRSERR